MGLKEDLIKDCATFHAYKWPSTIGRVVPVPADVALGDETRMLEQAVVLYADLDGSTSMVDTAPWYVSAEIYKSFLNCVAKIVKAEGGAITAYDGDRLMAVFIGEGNCDAAVRTSLKIRWAVSNIINPALKARYPEQTLVVKHVVGIDVSNLHVVRTGVRGDNDLVWVGRAANYAAKLTTLGSSPSWVTKAVHDKLSSRWKVTDGKDMWEYKTWTAMQAHPIRCTNWSLAIS